MTRTRTTLVALAILLVSTLLIAPAYAERTPGAFSVGFGTVPITVEGLTDVHVSDWETFGLGGAEGRIALPLSDGNTNAPMAPGIKLGYNYRLPQLVDVSFDLGIYVDNVAVLTLGFGADLYFVDQGWGRFGAMGRVGLIAASMSAGDANVLPGYASPVITSMGTINNGDTVSAQMNGLLTSAGMVAEFSLTETMSVRAETQFFYGVLSDLKITARNPNTTSSTDSTANNVELDVTSSAVVKTDGTGTQAGIDPSGSSTGLSTTLSLVWDL
ncbi:MAG: hypothetical protein VX834_09190 [Myxococcota bacterium]|nr:hypothetical protein [Myxococcota bacterium]